MYSVPLLHDFSEPMVDSFLVAALLGLNVTVSVCIWSEQDTFYITLSGTNINIHCYLTTFLLFTI